MILLSVLPSNRNRGRQRYMKTNPDTHKHKCTLATSFGKKTILFSSRTENQTAAQKMSQPT